MLHLKTAGIAVAISALMGASGAGAAVKHLITGADVKNESLTGTDVRDGSISSKELSPGVRALLAERGKDGTSGTNGVNGNQGAKGDAGAKGDTGTNGTNGTNGVNGAKGDTGATGPQGPKGTSGAMPADFAFTNSSVRLTDAGVQFGRYGDGGAEGGSLRYDGLNGKTLAQIAGLVYTAKYATSDNVTNAVPYLRIFLEGDTHDVIFSPNTQPAPTVSEGALHSWSVTDGTVRYDDDAGGPGPDPTWDDVVAAHGDEVVSGVYVTTGFSAGHDVSATLKEFGANGVTFTFGS